MIPDSFDQESRGSLTPCCPSQPPTGWTVAETVVPKLVWSWERGGEGRVSGISGPRVLWALPLSWDGPRPKCGPHLPSRHLLHVPGALPGGFPRPDELIYVRLCIRQDPRGPRRCQPAPQSLLRSRARASSLAGESSRVTDQVTATATRAALLATQTMLSPRPVLSQEGGEPAPLQSWQSGFTLRPRPRACGRSPCPDHLPKAPPTSPNTTTPVGERLTRVWVTLTPGSPEGRSPPPMGSVTTSESTEVSVQLGSVLPGAAPGSC